MIFQQKCREPCGLVGCLLALQSCLTCEAGVPCCKADCKAKPSSPFHVKPRQAVSRDQSRASLPSTAFAFSIRKNDLSPSPKLACCPKESDRCEGLCGIGLSVVCDIAFVCNGAAKLFSRSVSAMCFRFCDCALQLLRFVSLCFLISENKLRKKFIFFEILFFEFFDHAILKIISAHTTPQHTAHPLAKSPHADL